MLKSGKIKKVGQHQMNRARTSSLFRFQLNLNKSNRIHHLFRPQIQKCKVIVKIQIRMTLQANTKMITNLNRSKSINDHKNKFGREINISIYVT